ncbi:GNAT family N-acetyltransferase [Lacticaseibacillus paracasei]|uniref:GNAT family N-acetyltransferase n=1 Tax=Lacticaseibacillus paracasei TaxID=1597 RepID=UPI00272BACE3|nr:GNAT family N-acetyltransferase [Lacticaseibacillus paracasei]WKZ96081.1 GNAT family N-acetyltransferase [Lacticaseibacillus paracasei]
MKLEPIDRRRSATTKLFKELWGSDVMVLSGIVYHLNELPGFVAIDEQNILGMITYLDRGNTLEVISLDSLRANQGIGSALLQKVETTAVLSHKTGVELITTNDNLHALGFYQRRGYRLTQLFPEAVDQSRKIKPQIPAVADNGIPIRDELRLLKNLLARGEGMRADE